jgi:hypothetical protein
MIKVFYRDESIDDDSGLVVFEVGTNNYVVRSFNWWNRIEGGSEPLTGMEFNIRDGKLTAYSSNNDQAGKYIVIDASDDSSNYPLMVGTPGSEALKMAWDGSLIINGSQFNDAVFAINAEGKMKATSGDIGGWSITSSSLESKASTGTQKMILGSNGSIKIGVLSGTGKTDSAFEVTNTGVMKAANYELSSGKINTALLMRGKMRIAETSYSGTVSSVETQQYRLHVDGTTFLSSDVYVGVGTRFITVKANGNVFDDDNKTTMSFTAVK